MSDTPETTFPVLPVKNTVLFPYLFMPLSVGTGTGTSTVPEAFASSMERVISARKREFQVLPSGPYLNSMPTDQGSELSVIAARVASDSRGRLSLPVPTRICVWFAARSR